MTIAQLRALLAAGSPLPWHWRSSEHEPRIPHVELVDAKEGYPSIITTDYGCYGPEAKDAALIVAAANALPALLDIADAAAECCCADHPDNDGGRCSSCATIRRVRAALAKLEEK